MRSHFLSVSFFKTVNTSPFRKVAVESAVCFGDAIAISIQPESRPSIAGYAHRLLEKKFVCFCGSKRRLPDEGRLLRLTAPSTRPDAPARRRPRKVGGTEGGAALVLRRAFNALG